MTTKPLKTAPIQEPGRRRWQRLAIAHEAAALIPQGEARTRRAEQLVKARGYLEDEEQAGSVERKAEMLRCFDEVVA